MEIRSYRNVFDLERRIYSIDRLRLNPAGVPVRGLAYFLALLLGALIVGRLPFVALASRVLPWYLRDVALPALGATVLGSVRLEGRTFHHTAYALLRQRARPRRLSGVTRQASVGSVWHPPDLVLLPDGSEGALRRMRYTGPGAVLVAVEHERRGRALERHARGFARRGLRSELRIGRRGEAGPLARGEVIMLAAGTRLLVESAARRR